MERALAVTSYQQLPSKQDPLQQSEPCSHQSYFGRQGGGSYQVQV